jgi:AraC-like DNA-binding protein
MMNFIIFIKPDKALEDYVQNYYIADLSGSPGCIEVEQKTISNGCVEMFIGYQNTRGICYTNIGDSIQTSSAIVGAQKLKNSIKAMAMGSYANTLKFVSINFRPNGFYKIFKIPSIEIYNRVIASNEVFGNEIKHLQERLDNTRSNNEIEYCLNKFLIKLFKKNENVRYNISAGFKIAGYIEYHKGIVHANQIKQDFNISERSLQRNFKLAMGLTISEYCKITRFKNLIDYINTGSNINWIDLVSQFGYYDQAHMINEFKTATGFTPSLFTNNFRKDIFKINNHLVILKTNSDCNPIREIISKGEESYSKSLPDAI